MEDMIRAIAALSVVLAAILGMGYALRRFSNGKMSLEGRQSDLHVLEWRGLDARRKLAVVQWDGREHLLCLGPAGDCHIASRDASTITEPEGGEES